MGLRLKTAAAISGVFLTVITATYLLFTHVILKEFDAIEHDKTQRNITRVFESLDGVADDLSGRIVDWAHWDETYAFIQGKNAKYLSVNANYEAIAPFELVHIIFLNNRFELIAGQEIATEAESMNPLRPETFSAITKNPAIAAYMRTPPAEPLSGLIMVEGNPLFIAVSPVTDNQNKKPSNGFVIFTRAFSANLQAEVSKRTQLPLIFNAPSLEEQQFATNTTPPSPFSAVTRTTQDEIIAEGTIRDLNQTPIMAVSFNSPRSIFQQGMASRDRIMSLMAICLVLANIVLVAFLNRSVIGRLERFARKISTLSDTQDFTLRMPVDGRDEIGKLTDIFNSLLVKTEQTTHQLTQAHYTALRATHAKSSFVAHVSHELRTPIHSLAGLLRILFKQESSPSKRAYIQMARDSSATLLATINDILDISKIESGSIELQAIPFSLRHVVRATTRTVSPRIDEKPLLQFLVDIEPGVPDCIIGDPLRVQQILVNLLGNAAKFTSEGAVSLRVGTRPSQDPTQANLTFEIADTGIGMTEEQVTKIFKPYVQADETIQTRFEGTGLGLSIVKQLTEQLGGDIRVASVPHQGTTFTVHLALPLTDQNTSVRISPQKWTKGVLIEDNARAASWLAEGLARFGCTVSTLTPFDVPLITHPEESWGEIDFIAVSCTAIQGPEFLQWLTQIAKTVTCPIITSLRSAEMAIHEQIQSLGTVRIIDAPSSPEEILQMASGTYQTPANIAAADSLTPIASATPVRVLVADDTPTSRLILQGLLEEAGYEVEVVENGEQALARVSHDGAAQHARPISILLTDVEMPVLGGVDLTKTIRELESSRPGAPRLPIIAITAHALVEERALFIKAGIDKVITKPLNPEDLSAALNDLLSTHTATVSRSTPYHAKSSPAESLLELTQALWSELQPDNGSHNPIDIADVFERSGDSLRRTRLILSAFLDSYEAPFTKLRALSTATDSEEMIIPAHSMRGLLLDVGAKHAASLAASIESALRAGNREAALATSAVFEEHTRAVAALIGTCLDNFPPAQVRVAHPI